MNRRDPQVIDRLAAEYVLGAMQGKARRRFERWIDQSPEVRVMVERWTEELLPIGMAGVAQEPSAKVWRAIEKDLDRKTKASNAISIAGWTGYFLRHWFGTGAAAFRSAALGVLVGVGVMAFVGLDQEPTTRGNVTAIPAPHTQSDVIADSYVSVLLDSSGRATVLATAVRDGSIVSVKIVNQVTSGADREIRLWLVAANGTATFVGLVPEGGSARLPLVAQSLAILATPDVEFVLSSELRSEPREGGLTSSVIARGRVVKSW